VDGFSSRLDASIELGCVAEIGCPPGDLTLCAAEEPHWVKRKFRSTEEHYHSWNCFWWKCPFPTRCCSLFLYLSLSKISAPSSLLNRKCTQFSCIL